MAVQLHAPFLVVPCQAACRTISADLAARLWTRVKQRQAREARALPGHVSCPCCLRGESRLGFACASEEVLPGFVAAWAPLSSDGNETCRSLQKMKLAKLHLDTTTPSCPSGCMCPAAMWITMDTGMKELQYQLGRAPEPRRALEARAPGLLLALHPPCATHEPRSSATPAPPPPAPGDAHVYWHGSLETIYFAQSSDQWLVVTRDTRGEMPFSSHPKHRLHQAANRLWAA